MKFLEIPSVAQLNSFLDNVESISGEYIIRARIETYSCKRAGSDKKLFKSLDQQYQVELSKSPEFELIASTSPFGPLSESASRKTLFHLISLLNAAFPDYDFCNVKPEQFRKEISHYMVINSINTTLSGVSSCSYLIRYISFKSLKPPLYVQVIDGYNTIVSPKLWSVLDSEIKVKECDIYSYIPDLASDPYAEDGNVWSFNYFFFNKKLKRIIFFTCRAVSKMSLSPQSFRDDLSEVSDGVWLDEMDM